MFYEKDQECSSQVEQKLVQSFGLQIIDVSCAWVCVGARVWFVRYRLRRLTGDPRVEVPLSKAFYLHPVYCPFIVYQINEHAGISVPT